MKSPSSSRFISCCSSIFSIIVSYSSKPTIPYLFTLSNFNGISICPRHDCFFFFSFSFTGSQFFLCLSCFDLFGLRPNINSEFHKRISQLSLICMECRHRSVDYTIYLWFIFILSVPSPFFTFYSSLFNLDADSRFTLIHSTRAAIFPVRITINSQAILHDCDERWDWVWNRLENTSG